MAKSLNIVIGADIEKLREGFNKAISIVQSSGNKMSAEVAKSAKAMEERLAAIATRNPTMGSVRQLTQLAMEARALGPEFAQVANEIIKQAGRMKDGISDTRAEVSYFASDTRRLDAVLGGVQAVAGAFGAVQGAAALFGNENEDLQKSMMKLQGAIALVTGVTAIQKALEAESTFMKGLNVQITKIQTYVMGQATVAARAYSAALLATGAVAIIAGLALVYSALQNNADAAEKAEEAQKKYADSVKDYNDRALKYVERELEYKKNLAVKNAQLAGKTEEEIAKIELDHMNIRLKALNKMHDQLSDSSELKLELTQTTQALENEITLKGLDIQIAAKDKATKKNIELTEKQFKKELDLIIAHGKGMNDAERFLIDQNKKLRDKAVADKLKSKEFNAANMIAGTGVQPILLQVKIDPSSYSETVQKMKTLTQELNSAFATLQTEAAASFAQLIADVATGDKEAGKNFGKNMLGAIAGFMDTLGKAIVATAIATDAFKKLIVAHPIAAAAAGIALMASAAIVRNTLAKGPEVTAFADGGIVSGPTLGLMGEYPGASSNPEVIAPLDKLKGMLNNTDNNSGFVASTSVSGRDLAIVLERYNRDSKRG
jgi:hypothetical protein